MTAKRKTDLVPQHDHRDVVAAFERALDQSAAVLRGRPAEVFPQFCARLRSASARNQSLRTAIDRAARSYKRPWLRAVNWQPGPFVRMFAGHTSSVQRFYFSARGDRIVSSSLDGTVRLWETATGRELATFGGYPMGQAIVISPDDKHLAFPNDNREVVLASASDGQVRGALKFHNANATSCSFSPDGCWLATRGWDYRAAVWNVSTAELLTWDYVDGEHTAVIFLPNGRGILQASAESIMVWDFESGGRRRFSRAAEGKLSGVRISRDGALLASVISKRRVAVWNVEAGEVVTQQLDQAAEIVDFQFLSDSKRLLTVCSDGELLLTDAIGGETLRRIETTGGIDRVLIDPSERLMLVQKYERLTLVEIETGKLRAELAGHRRLANVFARVFTHDGRRLFTTSSDSAIRAWDTNTGECLAVFAGHSGGVSECAIDPSGRYLLSGGSDGALRLWNIEDESLWGNAAHTAEISCCAAGPKGFGIAASLDGTISRWDVEGNRIGYQTSAESSTQVRACAVSPDGELAAAGGPGGELKVFGAANGELVRSIREFSDPVCACGFSPDAERIVWRDMASGKFLAHATGDSPMTIIPGSAAAAARFIPPGDRLVTITNSHGAMPFTLGLNLQTSAALFQFDGHTGEKICGWGIPDAEACDVACSPDGSLLATAGRGVVRIWSVRDGENIAELKHPEGRVNSCEFSSDGRWIMASGMKVVRLWRTRGWREHAALQFATECAPVFLADGRYLATAESSSLVVWEVKDMRTRVTLTGLTGGISALALAADGRWLMTGTTQGEVLIAAVENLKCVPAVTAIQANDALGVRCPACGKRSEIHPAALGHAWKCACGMRVSVNSFVAQPHDNSSKAGFGVTPFTAAPAPAAVLPFPAFGPAALPHGSEARPATEHTGRKLAQSVPHPSADPEREYRRNLEYQQALARWRALPWWRRLLETQPEPPK